MRQRQWLALAAFAVAACGKEKPAGPVYQAVPVERRTIVVSAQAAGAINPDTTVEVKSRASGEVLEILAETGQTVKRGALLMRIDPREPRNRVAQAKADLDVARAQLENAELQLKRSEELHKSASITDQELETARLNAANARANVVRAQVALENAQIQLEDTDVRAPITGTIIQKAVERGQVIASATTNVGGGTVLMKMADLNLVQVRTLVDETDIGKIRPGMRATVTVDAYPNRPFEGEVLKIEPLAETQQNVTMFPVLVRIQNPEGLLRPGMNTEVEIHVGKRDSVLAIPNAALRTPKDVASAAQVLGLDPREVEKDLAQQPEPRAPGAGDSANHATLGANAPGAAGDSAGRKPGNTMTTPDGRVIPLPDGVTEQQVRAIFAKFRSGEQPTPAERQIMLKLRQAAGRGNGMRRGQHGSSNFQFGGNYIVFVLRNGKPTPVKVRTGLTDLDYSEVVAGLTDKDSVLVLPSASLVQSQQELKNRFQQMTGGGLGGLRQPQQSPQPQQGGARQ
ncbi:MAG: efflux RND transporter periplasmic adaptor subunit [Gemmatimonadota bacterium]